MDYSSPFYAHAELPDANTLYNPYAPHPSAQTQDVQTKPRKLKAPRVIRACESMIDLLSPGEADRGASPRAQVMDVG